LRHHHAAYRHCGSRRSCRGCFWHRSCCFDSLNNRCRFRRRGWCRRSGGRRGSYWCWWRRRNCGGFHDNRSCWGRSGHGSRGRHDGRPGDNGAGCWRTVCNRWRSHNDRSCGAWQGNDSPGSRGGRNRCCRSGRRAWSGWWSGSYCRACHDWRRSYCDRRPGWCSLSGGLSLLALEDSLQRIAGLGNVREIEGRLGLSHRLCRCCGACAAVEVRTNFLGFIFFDGA